MKVGGIGLAVVVLVLMLAGPASAAGLLSQTVSAASAVDKSCTSGERSGAGVAQKRVTMPAAGGVTARLSAASGDWDLAIIDPSRPPSRGRLRLPRRHRGRLRLRRGRQQPDRPGVPPQRRKLHRAAERRGHSDRHGGRPEGVSSCAWPPPTSTRKNELADLGLDLTEHGGPGFVEAVLYGAADAQKLVDNNFAYTTEVPDLAVQSRQERAADAQFAAANAASDLPSGRTTYRRLFDYSEDMKSLAQQNPDLVRPITLNNQTYEGRSGRGHRDRDEPERPRRSPRVPADGRAPRA